MIITIDGLSINGKSTLAEMISKEMNIKNLNTGAIYRCVALEILNKNLDINNIEEVINKISNINIDFYNGETLLNGLDVTTGTYGLKLLIYTDTILTPGVTRESVYELTLSSADMIGNPY